MNNMLTNRSCEQLLDDIAKSVSRVNTELIDNMTNNSDHLLINCAFNIVNVFFKSSAHINKLMYRNRWDNANLVMN